MRDQQKTIVVSEELELTIEDMSEYCQLPVEIIIEFVQLGLFEQTL